MSFIQAISSAFANYANFEGRALRSEYWYFVLFLIIADLVLSFADAAIYGMSWSTYYASEKFGLVGTIFSLATFLPMLAVTMRRLHDVGRSGWWCLIPITIIGIIPYLYWTCIEGNSQPNKYGDPIRLNNYHS